MKTIKIIPALFLLSVTSQAFAGLDENSKIDFDMQYAMGFYCEGGTSTVPYGQKWDNTFRGDIFFPLFKVNLLCDQRKLWNGIMITR